MKGKEELRLSQKLGMVRNENRVYSSPPSVPMERNALAEWQKRAEGSKQYFSQQHMHLSSQADSPDKTIVLEKRTLTARSKEKGCYYCHS